MAGGNFWGAGCLAVCALSWTGCQSTSREAHLQRQVEGLHHKVDSLVDALELQRENDSVNIDESTLLLTSADSTATIKTDIGYLTVELDSFRDFGSGSRTVFTFGNPAAVTLKGLKARLEWQVRTERGDSSFLDPVTYEFMEELKPGKQCKMAVILDIPADRILGVRLSRVQFRGVGFAGE